MGRPIKTTLDFFIWNRDHSQKLEVAALHRRHGLEGLGAYVLLLEKACQADYLQFDLSNELVLETVADQFRISPETLRSILDTCADLKLIDSEQWKANRVVNAIALEEQFERHLSANAKDRYRKQKADSKNGFPTQKDSFPDGKPDIPPEKCTDQDTDQDQEKEQHTEPEKEFDSKTPEKSESVVSGCGDGHSSVQEPLGSVGTTAVQSEQAHGNEARDSGEDKNSAAPPALLQRVTSLGINLDDPGVKKTLDEHGDRLPDLIATIESYFKRHSIDKPNSTFINALTKPWTPETPANDATKSRSSPEFNTWFNSARKRGLASASNQSKEGRISVLMKDDCWYPFDELKHLSLDELEAKFRTVAA